MTTIERMHVRWSGADEARRASLLAALLGDALPDALAALGVGRHGEVCVRRVEVPRLAVDVADRDEDIAARWAGRVADAIADGVGAGHAVVFRSRHHALADMAVQVAKGRLERAWAWRAAGVWPAGVAKPPSAPGPSLAGAPDPASLAGPAAFAGPTDPADPTTPPTPAFWVRPPRDTGVSAPKTGRGEGRVDDGGREGSAGDGGREGSAGDGGLGDVRDGGTVPADPGGRGPSDLTAGGPAAADAGRYAPSEPTWHAWDLDGAADALALALAGSPEAVRAVLAHVARLGLWPALAARLGPERLAALPAVPEAAHAAPPRVVEVVPEARTAWGGLLLLLNLVDGDDPATAHMHALGTALLAPLLREGERLDPRDPALLAFAGLAPDDEPPAPSEPPGDDEGRPDPAPLVERLAAFGLGLEHVVRRDAVIVADPGWIEVRFSLDDVDVAIRRVGLDLDPGWLPWLGVVVRFSYA